MDKCGVCNQEFKEYDEYLNHICTTGYKPYQFEHQVKLDPNYAKISESALKRGKK